MVLLAGLAGAGLRVQRLALVLLAVFAVQTFLPLLANVAPWAAALHPVNALVVAWLALRLAVDVLADPGRTRDVGPMTPGHRVSDDVPRPIHARGRSSRMKVVRYVAAGAAWLFLAGVVYQVFLAGVGIFGAGPLAQHREFGYLIPVASLALLVVLAVARAESTVKPALLLVVLAGIQGILPWFRLEAPFVAALHPVNALAIGYLGLVVARRATAFARAYEEPSGARAPFHAT
jgi:hypothetical protein